MGGPRALCVRFQGGSQSWMWRKIRSISSSWCGDVSAAMVFMGRPQEAQRLGSTCQVLAMSLAHARRRFLRKSETSDSGAGGTGPGDTNPWL